MIGVTVLGSTGSIGVNTLDVLRRHPDLYRVVALAANSSVDKLLQQVIDFQPQYAVLVEPLAAEQLRQQIVRQGLTTEVLEGADALEFVASLSQVDAVMAAIVGAAGLRSALAAATSGKRVLLANKESLVVAGQLFMDAVERHQATLLPIDSEHNAIFQCMPADGGKEGVRRILLTASGGPFRSISVDALQHVTPEQACAHPNWDMGKKISVDSATMMNKGLEVIEARWLFDLAPDEIQVVVHPQSVVHSMVEYVDGSVLAQMGNPDMRTPIAHALAWPRRIDSGVAALDLFAVARLDFEQPDFARFPCLQLAYDVVLAGGVMPAVLNAANEVSVEAFLNGRIPFTAIPRLNQAVMESAEQLQPQSIEQLLEVDQRSRRQAEQFIPHMV
ncbi:MAG: 1-deoxy-D-xylulose-5-phosphate reductoisomerase [Pseudomonadota bacterium]|nr:1-deoxy-D-xylulose-5-phosphate reductoisomerase [Pseudomonadota bacterium]